MQVTEFGQSNKITIMLLPGTCMTWELNFSRIILPLAQKYHLLAVNYTGFDGGTETFENMITETKKIEDWVKAHCHGAINAVYGSSLGGSFASLLLQRKEIHMDHVFIGSSDLDQATPLSARAQTALIAFIFFGAARSSQKQQMLTEFLAKKLGASKEALNRLLSEVLTIVRMSDKQSVINQFYSDLVTPIENDIQVTGTKIHVLHSRKMDTRYLERYFQHYHHPDVISLNQPHENWLKDPDFMMDLFKQKIGE